MIRVSNLTHRYKEGNLGLENINLEFKKGEITMIIGPNGSGKSTLLSSIANLSKYEGIITLNNIDIKKIKNIVFRKQVGIVFQNPNNQIIFNKVYDDIKFTLENLEVDNIDERIRKALKKVGMLKHINSNPYNLSMGERQRVALASVLATNKEFLLLDEVTSMVDYNGKQDIYKLIIELKKQNLGIIMTTNIVDELIYADKVIILDMNHYVKGVYTKKEIFDNLNLLKDFYIPFKFQVIHQIGFANLKKFSDEELLQYVK